MRYYLSSAAFWIRFPQLLLWRRCFCRPLHTLESAPFTLESSWPSIWHSDFAQPPYGCNLFVGAAVAKIRMESMFKYIVPFFIVAVYIAYDYYVRSCIILVLYKLKAESVVIKAFYTHRRLLFYIICPDIQFQVQIQRKRMYN